MRGGRLIYALAFLLAAALLVGPAVYKRLFPPVAHYVNEVTHFKYGSVGAEAAAGIPYQVWRTLPGVCLAEADPKAGYKRFGFQWEPGHAAPIGMPIEEALVPRVGVSCAMCHVGRVDTPDGRSTLLVGAPNTSLDLQAYLRFLFDCAASPKFTADAILDENDRLKGGLNPVEKLIYRTVIIPQTKDALLKQKRELSFMDGQPDWGPGRTAGFQPAKVQVLGMTFDGTLDIVDIPPLWRMNAREGGGLHWDGANTSLREVFLNSGIGNGATAATINRPHLARMERWTRNLPSASYPWPVDAVKVQAGKAIFNRECFECHVGAKVNQVIPVTMVGTDRNRLDAMTPATVQAFLAADGYPWRYTHFRKTRGYVATPLDGIWARAPYLHNGSVPSLAALLTPPDQRPATFGRGSTRYDPVGVGFATDAGKVLDTRLPGNGAQGHAWGTTLPEADRAALLEYLKTL